MTQPTRPREAVARRAPARRLAPALALAFVLAAVALPQHPAAREAAPPRTATLEALFTPGDPIDARLSALIDGAKREVLVQAFSFTSKRIARALLAAHRRGVQVAIVADRAQTLELATSAVPGLARDGVPVWLDGNFVAAHNKVLVVDADTPAAAVVTGSYNFTSAAQFRNAENVLIVRGDRALAAQYRENLLRLRAKAVRYEGGAS
ncbi:MAG: phospholipase D family protein [Casimicrobiaceae bacterium]